MDDEKNIDLEPHEYGYEGKHEPIFGFGLFPFLIYSLSGLFCYFVVAVPARVILDYYFP
jgi:hypothetical protein